MNIIAIDIGNTSISLGLFLDDEEQSIKAIPGGSRAELAECLKAAWRKIPVIETSTEGKRDGVIVISSVKPAWTKLVQEIAAKELAEKPHVVGMKSGPTALSRPQRPTMWSRALSSLRISARP